MRGPLSDCSQGRTGRAASAARPNWRFAPLGPIKFVVCFGAGSLSVAWLEIAQRSSARGSAAERLDATVIALAGR